MNYDSPEIRKTLKALTQQTKGSRLFWEVAAYDPVCFMPEIGVEVEGAETENFALNTSVF